MDTSPDPPPPRAAGFAATILAGAARRAAAALLDLIAPTTCLACGVAGPCDADVAGLCATCARLVLPPPEFPCPVCAAPLGPGIAKGRCAECAELRPAFSTAVSGTSYAGLGGELVRRAKYGRDPALAWPLEHLVARAVAAWPGREGVAVVVPVPTTAARRRERGFHLAERLASAAARACGVAAHGDVLERVGDPQPQAALPRSERIGAARGTVAVRRPRLRRPPDVRGRIVLVVDDVLTTGATVNECAKVLVAAGAAEVRVAAAARA